ncbi:thioredoxin [Lysobacter xinjiangensis]|uniref:Thioredoxin n=1 Tax=Cognatilysobacter xinjiangensis TaxID=546892 RepID=A0ABQ3C869_9GAMM|nr:thioredoxin [Lysobacter xinjiangensis]
MVAVAVVAGLLGVAASLAVDRSWLARTRLGQAILQAGPTDAAGPVARVGERLPAIALPTLDGETRHLADLAAGRPLLVNFWASWCRPCLEEMPALDAFARRQGANGVQVVGIALDEADAVRSFLDARPVGYTVLVDSPGPADSSVRLGNARGVLPYSVLVGTDGRILKQWAGPLEPDDLDGWAREARPTRD